jgi:hypothetical protein
MGCEITNYKVIFKWLTRALLCLGLLIFAINQSYSQIMPVPENIQAALLPKVLKFNTTLSEKKTVRMLIVYDNNSRISKDEFLKELRSVFEVKAISSNEIEQNITNTDLVYFMPGLQDKALICKKYKVLSVSGISQYVEDGQVSLAFGILNNKPKIYINIKSLEAEGQNLSSDILRIAKVYK